VHPLPLCQWSFRSRVGQSASPSIVTFPPVSCASSDAERLVSLRMICQLILQSCGCKITSCKTFARSLTIVVTSSMLSRPMRSAISSKISSLCRDEESIARKGAIESFVSSFLCTSDREKTVSYRLNQTHGRSLERTVFEPMSGLQ
jgi:hypothetical protein